MIGRLEVLPGPGTAARYGELTVWAGAGASADLLSFLIQSAQNLASLPDGGRRIADHLAGVLRQRDPEPAVPFVTVGPGEYTPVTLLHGPVQMWDGARWVRPDPGIGWLVAEVSNLTTVLVTPNDTPAPPSANPILDLRLGVVPGGGLAVVLTPASMLAADEPSEARPAEAAGELDTPSAATSPETELLTAGSELPAGTESPSEVQQSPEIGAAPETGSVPETGFAPESGLASETEPSGTAAPEDRSSPGVAPLAEAALAAREVEIHEPPSPEPAPATEPAGRDSGVRDELAAENEARALGEPALHESHPEVEDENPPPGSLAVEAPETLLATTEPPNVAPPAGGADLAAPPGPDTAAPEPIGTVDLRSAPSESWTPLPPVEAGAPNPPGGVTVRGLRCPRGHFNHGAAVTCVYCNLPLDPIRGQSDGPRPVLGVLVGTDRSLWRVDASYLLGTDPAKDPAVTSGQARALTVPDDGQAQAVHAELRASGWTLSVVDRNSRTGTFVLPPGHSDWQRVPPDQAVTIKPGTHVAIGSTVFTFTSPWPL